MLLVLLMLLILMFGCANNEAVEEVSDIEYIAVAEVVREVAVEAESEVEFENEYDTMIYRATENTVVDPYLAIAISRLETGHYTSDAFVEGYNFGGITVSSGVKRFDSLDEGLERYISLLEWYHDNGMDTAEKMQSTYCPPNEKWDETVESVYDDFIYREGI